MTVVLNSLGMGLMIVLSFMVGACSDAERATNEIQQPLVIYGTTDRERFSPVIAEFKKLHPEIAVQYTELDAGPLHKRFLDEVSAKRTTADLILSSAMDLQVQLVNDGYAASHNSADARALPRWARWRDQAFGFTFEPAVMVFNKNLIAAKDMPRSRSAMLSAVRKNPEFWRNRIGTYDIARSNVGYLLATQDARQNSESGSLTEAFGDVGLKTMENTSSLLDQIERGTLILGYNLLGSYAQARADAGAPIAIVYPQDYTLAVSRTALIPNAAKNPTAAHQFLNYLLSLQGQRTLSSQSRLSAVRADIAGSSPGSVRASDIGIIRPVALGPGLLVYLDAQKRRRFLENWQAASSSR